MAFNLLNLKEKIRAYFNPTSNQGNNFWSSPVARGLGKAQESLIYRAQNTPRIQLPQIKTGAPVADFGLNLAKAIPESIINIPRNYAVGVGRTGLELGSAIAEKRPINIRNLAGGVAPLAESIVDVGTMGFYNPAKTLLKEGVKNVAKQGAKQLIKKGAITGAGFGGFNGLTYGLDEQYNTPATPENFKELLGNIGSGIVLGGVLGGGMAGSGALYGKIKNAVAKVFPNKSGVEQAKIIREFVRDQAGRFAVQGATNKKTPKYISDIRAELGMEKYPDYSMKIGLGVKAKNSAQAGLYDIKKLQKSLGEDAGEIVYRKDLDLTKQTKDISQLKPQSKLDLSSKTTRDIVDGFKKSIKEGKEIPPVVLDEAGNVVDGAHRLQAYKELGIKDVPIVGPNVAQQPSTKAGLYDTIGKPKTLEELSFIDQKGNLVGGGGLFAHDKIPQSMGITKNDLLNQGNIRAVYMEIKPRQATNVLGQDVSSKGVKNVFLEIRGQATPEQLKAIESKLGDYPITVDITDNAGNVVKSAKDLNVKQLKEFVAQQPSNKAGLYDTTLTGQRPNQELLNSVQKDMQLGKQTTFQFKPGDKVVSNGKDFVVKSSYIENGKPRYEVYTPGKKNSPAHQFRLYESDIIKPNEKINTSTSGAKSQQIGQTNSQTPTGENRGGVGQILVQNQTNPYTKENVKQLLNQNPQNPQLNNLYYGLRNFEGDVSNILNDSEKRLINKYVAQQPSTKAGLYDTKVYSGSSPARTTPSINNKMGSGKYFSEDPNYAKTYAGINGKVEEKVINPQKIYDLDKNGADWTARVRQEFDKLAKGKQLQEGTPAWSKVRGEAKDVVNREIQAQGYEGVSATINGKKQYNLFNVAQQPLGEVSNPKGMSKGLKVSVPETGKIEVNTPQRSGISIRTKPNSAVSSVNSITEKGKLNIKNLKIKGEGKKVLQGVQKQVQPTVIGNKEVVKMARTANGTGTMSDEQMKKLMAQQLKNRQKVVDLTVQYNNAKKNGASEVELGKIMLGIVNESRTAQQGGTFAGRLLQAQNILAEESASPMQKILALLDNAGVSEEKYLKDAIKVNWDSPNEVVSFYRKYVPAKFGEILDEIRYSNMLSSPLTHIINTVSNALQTGIVAPIEKTVTGALDWGKSLLTGSERKYYTSSGIDYAGGYIKALPQAFKKAFKVLSGDEILVKPDYERIPTGAKGVLKAYTLPLRGLEAMDQFFKTLVEGGVTSELKKAPQKLSLDQISSSATKEANYRLFRQAFDPDGKLGQGYVLRYFDKWNNAIANLRRLPGGKWILPFLQTPTNILKQGVEFSPLGFTTAIGAEAPIQQISKALIGTTVFVGAYQLASNGLTSWEAPSGEKERELYYAAGMQPYSVKMGDKWVSFSKLGPLSYPIAMAAALADAERQNPDKSKMENIGKSISGMLGFFGDQSYVRSIGELVDAIQGGVNIGATALSSEGANLAGQLVPYKSFLTWLGRMTDPVYRKATTFGEKMIKDLPIVGKTLKPYTDINDNPSVRDFPILNSFSPYKVTQEKDSSAQLLKQYQTKKIENAVEKRANDKFLQSAEKGETQVSDNTFKYIDDKGSVKEIDLNFPMPELKTTGDELLDKELLSDYKGELTKLKNSIMEAWEVGAIDQGEAIAQLKKITEATNKTKKAKAPKKISIKRIANRKISINISKSKIKTMPTIKAPKIKISKAKKIRV